MTSKFLWLALLLPALGGFARAELVSLEIHRREPFAGATSFGEAGPYEKLVGVARFSVDPNHPANRDIVDLDKAPRNAAGKVEFESDVYILAPHDPRRGNGAIFHEVNNRGLKLCLRAFNDGPQLNDPATEADAGDGFLFRRGYTVVWCGWIGELLPGDHKLLLRPPIANENGQPIRGIVRYETTSNVTADSLPLARREGLGSFRPTPRGEKEGVLTWRMRETDPRAVIPRQQWTLERGVIPSAGQSVSGTLAPIRMRVAGGFRPGYLYELVCEAEGPAVQGTGYLAVRDLVSFLRYDESERNPLRGAIRRAHAFGISQSGRFLRNFLYLDLNADERNRKVFDGLLPNVSGGGLGFFNHRFAQASRYNAQHEEHLYPCDRFPFGYADDTDPFSGRTDSIQRRTAARDASLLPKIFHIQNASEYWHRSGSLVHTDARGAKDAPIPENVRIYTIGGTQHGHTHNPVADTDNPPNPANPQPYLKALLDALDAWVRDGTAPPPSVSPRLDRATLVPPDMSHSGFPAIPGVHYPSVIQRPYALDYGPEFESKGIISIEPPRVLGDYVVLVPKSDADGNDLGTLLLPEAAVPLATYTGWNLRGRSVGAEGMLAELMGSMIPFPRTRAERESRGDPRPSIAERYGTFEEYRRRYAAACKELVSKRLMLQEDADRLIGDREKVRALFGALGN
ncbi:MAG: hypothetical protein HY735_37860 [Verrucomicrobia bacterium]|nr:hypothetical protein [Verrucomicrobiota bacterium]